MDDVYVLTLRQFVNIEKASIKSDTILGVYQTYNLADQVRLRLDNKDKCHIEKFKVSKERK